MGSMKWTEDQQRVIDARDSNILVSAAAGSGKTAVLVERARGAAGHPHIRARACVRGFGAARARH